MSSSSQPSRESSPAWPVELAPTAASERIELLDVLRGFALLGVLLMHIEFFVSPSYHAVMVTDGGWGTLNLVTTWAIRFLTESKFFSLFAFCFGYSMALQMARVESRKARFVPLYARRLGILLLIGLAHGTLLWAYEILFTYALIGFVLLLFRKRSNKTVLVASAFFLLFQVLFVAGMVVVEPPATQQGLAESAAEEEAWAQEALHVYAHGSLAEIMRRRWMDWQLGVSYVLAGAPMTLGLFLLGLFGARHRLLDQASARRVIFRKMIVVGLTLGILGNAAYVIVMQQVAMSTASWSWVWSTAIIVVAAPALSGLYAGAIIVLSPRPAWHKVLGPLAPVGRTALTNYIMQSVICTTLVCSYGLGLYGRIQPPVAVALAVIVFLAQVAASNLWLRWFRFGPAEWVWRSATYGRVQPMRV